jgi:hypothetical protein
MPGRPTSISNLGLAQRREVDRLRPVGRDADDLDARVELEERPQSVGEDQLIVDDQHAHRLSVRRPHPGTVAPSG